MRHSKVVGAPTEWAAGATAPLRARGGGNGNHLATPTLKAGCMGDAGGVRG